MPLAIAGAVVVGALGGPWWLPLCCLAFVVLPGGLAIAATGVLVYLTWWTWWMALPPVLLIARFEFELWARRFMHKPSVASALLLQQHTAYGELAVLEEGIQLSRRAVADARPGSPEIGFFQVRLANALTALFLRTRQDALIDEATELTRGVVAACPPGDPKRADLLGAWGTMLWAAAEHGGRPDLADEAVTVLREAAALGGELHELCAALVTSFTVHQRPEDLAAAIRVGREAVARSPGSHPERGMAQFHLGRALAARYEHDGDRVALAGSCAAYAEAASMQSTSGNPEVVAAQRAAEMYIRAGDNGAALAMAESAVRQLPRITPWHLGFDDRVNRSIKVLDLASTAAEAAILAGAPGRALELMEQVRSVAMGKELARRDNRAGTIGKLSEQATRGPIIYVVAHRDHGSALILTSDPGEPVVVDLPLFTRQAVDQRVTALQQAQQIATEPGAVAGRQQAQRDVLAILAWLWDAAAAPVLDALGHTGPPGGGQPWPRIWWCPVGLCALLPLHAAGRHADGGHDTALDRVISSYTTTIRALAHSHRARSRPRQAASVLVVSVPEAPGVSPLPGAAAETRLLERLLPATTILRSPGHATVIEALPHHEITHFACHGVADLLTSTENRLLLQDHLERPLTVTAISGLRLDHGELAYLSACSVTHTTAFHADETTHLTAAFQLAGYRAVVGTLWPVNDHAATMITEDFYRGLLGPGTSDPDPTTAATALHHAVRAHRARHPALPTQWAAHVHHGL
ncbi:CHAT domain-containing protein [Actinoplanes sp. CA-051413]|uniref:CHAT domain-containing protein n=1 Tax=Actinoplanes sp. CA-051413 TaxID=3239899 RepID=UPI003D96D1DB